MSETKEYLMAVGRSTHDFNEYVQRLLGQGFQPYGHPFSYTETTNIEKSESGRQETHYVSVCICQAMTKSAE
ncbi:MAG: hypothetical protein ACYSWO_15150 [Planctomycetota bacterium]|jgi:hypothetical protein